LTPVNARLISMNIYLGEKQEKMISMLPEKAEDEKQHGRRHVGRFLGELEPCSIGDLQELNKAYTLVSVYRKKYPNKPPMKGFYWVVRVVLCLNEFLVSEEVSKDISENKETYWKSVSTLWQSFLFRTRAHINPFFDGEEDPIKGFGTVSQKFRWHTGNGVAGRKGRRE